MPFFRSLIGEKAGTFALLKTVVESNISPKPSPVGEGAELAEADEVSFRFWHLLKISAEVSLFLTFLY
jgi:hypothetical protein